MTSLRTLAAGTEFLPVAPLTSDHDPLWTEQGPLPNPCHSSHPIVWQVFLGANTPKRLANELGIGIADAYKRLISATKAGYIKRVSKGVYSAIR